MRGHGASCFNLILIKPSHYDDAGYPIPKWKQVTNRIRRLLIWCVLAFSIPICVWIFNWLLSFFHKF